jgi:hypothetical protein
MYYFLNKLIFEILYPMYVPIVFKITSSISEVLKDIINWTTSMLTDKNKPISIIFFDLLMDVKINPNGTKRMMFPKILTINCLMLLNSLNSLINGIKFNPPSETPIPKEATGKNVNLKINTSEKINSKYFMKIGFKINLPKNVLINNKLLYINNFVFPQKTYH